MRRNERGIALLLCILSLMVLSGIAIGLMYMTDSETMINSNYRSSQQAYFAALSGLQQVRERMTPANVAPHLVTGPTVMPGTAGSVIYVINPAGAADPVTLANIKTSGNSYFDNQFQSEITAQGMAWPVAANSYVNPPIADDGPYANTTAAVNYKWVRITAKANASTAPYYTNGKANGGGVTPTTQICWNGSSEVPASQLGVANCALGGAPPAWNAVYQLTSFAVTPTGASRMLQMEVSIDPPLSTHGAVDSQDHVTLNGALDINAYDYCSCMCTAFDKDGKCTQWGNRPGKTCDPSKYAIYSAGSVDNPNNSETFISGQNPAIAQNQPWTWDMNALVDRYKSDPSAVSVTSSPYNWSCSGGNCGTHSGPTFGVPPVLPPTPVDNPIGVGQYSQITYVPGDLQLTAGSQGNGVLVIDGNLDIHGGLSLYGLIIVKGVIKFSGGGSDKVNIYGAVIAGEQSLVDNVLGGSAVIDYDYCALPQPDKTKPPRMLALRDLNP
jgi:Tfp pilus assembly protein PilX